MSELPLAPVFSAAHVSKWDALPEDTVTLTRATRSGPEPKRTTGATGQSNRDADGVFSTGKCEVSMQVAASVSGTDSPARYVRHPRANMPYVKHTWITLWFLLTAPVILWDATYCFMRPRSMVGGDLHWIWEPYGTYQNVDYVYGLKALEENNGFTNAQALLNVVETSLNLAYVYLAHVSSWSGAPLVGFAAATMTLSKTMLYWAQEYFCGGCAVGHNAWGNLLLYWAFPNALWLVFPSMIVWRLGGDIMASLSVASQSSRKAASGKTQ